MEPKTEKPQKKGFAGFLTELVDSFIGGDVTVETDNHSFKKSKENGVEIAIRENNTETTVKIANSKIHISKKTKSNDPK